MSDPLDRSGLAAEVSVGVTYASLMSAASLFFTGILISQYHSFSSTIRVPVVFLITSTLVLIFAGTIYSNAGAELTLNKLKVTEKYLIYGKNLVELMGLYLFIFSIPLIIGAVTGDTFLRITAIIAVITGFVLYSQSKFSILDKELSNSAKRLSSLSIAVLAVALYYFQASTVAGHMFAYAFLAVTLIVVLSILTYCFCVRSKQYKPALFRAYQEDDAEVLADIVARNLSLLKSKKASADLHALMQEQSTPDAIKKLASDLQLRVVEFDGKIVGFAALKGNELRSIFTDPRMHRKGIGRMMLEHVETQAEKQGYDSFIVMASAIDRGFYEKLGYRDNKAHPNENPHRVPMDKHFYRK